MGLKELDAAVMELKAKLYQQASASTQKSKLTHETIAKKVGTSRQDSKTAAESFLNGFKKLSTRD